MEILFCIPGGGTSSLMYMGWQKLLKDEFTIIPLEIPGRGRLREMERASSLEEIAEGMARQVCEQANGRSYGIFGYCYGGISWHTRSAGFWRRKENVCRRIFIFVEHQLLLRRFLSHRC